MANAAGRAGTASEGAGRNPRPCCAPGQGGWTNRLHYLLRALGGERRAVARLPRPASGLCRAGTSGGHQVARGARLHVRQGGTRLCSRYVDDTTIDRYRRLLCFSNATGEVRWGRVRFSNKSQTEYLDCAPIRAQFVREISVFVELAKLFILGFSMLVARRDPPFHVDAKDAAPLNPNVYPPPRASRTARVVTAMQLIGSLLAVPVGIASAYSFYRANFAPETNCQNLRSGIISLLDKSVDASTRRMLVRRDVQEFEKSCAAVDPDATAAFKSLLAAEKTAAPAAPAAAAAPAAPKVQRTETAPPKEAVRKPDPRPQVTAKPPATNPAVASPAQVPAQAPVAAATAGSEP